MAPRAQRMAPPYVQITDHYRAVISSGDLREGDRLPAIRDIAREWEVASATAAKAVNQLAAEGYVHASPSGTTVTRRRATSPQDRILGTRRLAGIVPQGEHSEIREVDLREIPTYVADILGTERGGQVLRRERITYRGGDPIELSVTWIPGDLAKVVPALAGVAPIPGGTVQAIEDATGRTVTHGRDYIEARSADEREAKALDVPFGTAVLAVANIWSDDHSVIEYGECVMPAKRVITYEYAVTET